MQQSPWPRRLSLGDCDLALGRQRRPQKQRQANEASRIWAGENSSRFFPPVETVMGTFLLVRVFQALDQVPLEVNPLLQFQSSLALLGPRLVIQVLKVCRVPHSTAIPRASTVVQDKLHRELNQHRTVRQCLSDRPHRRNLQHMLQLGCHRGRKG